MKTRTMRDHPSDTDFESKLSANHTFEEKWLSILDDYDRKESGDFKRP